jgi:hypothetical protein
LFQPIDKYLEKGWDVSKGMFHAFSGVFSTQTQLAYSMFVILILCILYILIGARNSFIRLYYYISICSAVLLVYLSTRRAVFGAAIAATMVFFWLIKKKNAFALPVVALFIFGGLYFLDINSQIVTRNLDSRSEALLDLQLEDKIEIYVVGWTLRWFWEKPLGSCLGCFGPEGSAFGMPRKGIIEVGIHLLLAEMGIVGLFLFVCTVFIPGIIIQRVARHSKYRNVIRILGLYQLLFVLLFLIKAALIVTIVSMAQIFFWASFGIAISLLHSEKLEQHGSYPII